ncbi:hypothetical protein BJY01DRAFT_229793 [Aspergillus pseudoustus]|uniref:Uncharacterized protein n=1 Tax=Aspergillus pseudoustus TaxID=1810923 RepID=A0ABR4IF07_9EURO
MKWELDFFGSCFFFLQNNFLPGFSGLVGGNLWWSFYISCTTLSSFPFFSFVSGPSTSNTLYI